MTRRLGRLIDFFSATRDSVVVVRGGGDLATGIIYRLWRAGFSVLCLERERPLAVRRPVSVAQAVFDGIHEIEGMRTERIASYREFRCGATVSVLVDPDGVCIDSIEPVLVVDAIMAKRNTGTHRGMSPLVLAIGPGFHAPDEVHGVVETKRGHYLGRLITAGAAIPNTGVPGLEMGYTTERLLLAPCSGFVSPVRRIGEHVKAGELVATVEGQAVCAQIDGVLRGLIHPSVAVTKGLKIGDIDPRNDSSYCFTITDKAFTIAGGILEGILSIEIQPECRGKTYCV